MSRIVLIEIYDKSYDWDYNPIQAYIETTKTEKEIKHILGVLQKLFKEGKISFDTLKSSVEIDIGKKTSLETYGIDV